MRPRTSHLSAIGLLAVFFSAPGCESVQDLGLDIEDGAAQSPDDLAPPDLSAARPDLINLVDLADASLPPVDAPLADKGPGPAPDDLSSPPDDLSVPPDLSCPNNFLFCPKVGCVNSSYDNNNCGNCGVVCNTPTMICYQAKCISCPFSICNNQCINTFENRDACGSCTKVCAPNQVCSMTNCVDCLAPSVVCGNRCSNLMTAHQDCGSCTHACNNQQMCINGMCM